MRQARRRRARLELPRTPGVLVLAACVVPLAVARGAAAERRALGTVRTLGRVEWRLPARQWRRATNGALVGGGTFYRTARDSAALLQLGAFGTVGLEPDTEVEVGPADSGSVALRVVSGSVRFRIPRRSHLRLIAFGHDGGVLHVRPAPVAGSRVEGTMSVSAGGRVDVAIAKGAAQLGGTGAGRWVVVRAGEVASARSLGDVPSIRLASERGTAATAERRGQKRKLARIFACESHLGAVAAVAAGAIAAAGTVGGLAAAGEFSAGGGGRTHRVREASPFLP